MTASSLRGAALLAALCLLGSGLVACASDGTGEPGRLPPAGSPLARLSPGMNGAAVLGLIGEPHDVRVYQIWKAWNPFYFGQDTARTDWIYAGEGHAVFVRNRYSGRLTLMHVAYDPDAER
jgi:hypothetical protein